MNYLNSLNDLFPDTQDELENRHSSHLGDLKKRFTKTYGGFEPIMFISTKALLSLSKVMGTDICLDMALQNGTVLALAPTQLHQDIYINTLEQDDQIILSYKGDVVENYTDMASFVSASYKKGLKNVPMDKLMGGIIYFDVTVQPTVKGYQGSIQMALALAALVINNVLSTETLQELEQRVQAASMNAIKYSLHNNMHVVFNWQFEPISTTALSHGNYTFLIYKVTEDRQLLIHSQLEQELEALEIVAQQIFLNQQSLEDNMEAETPYSNIMKLIRKGGANDILLKLKPGFYSAEQYESMLCIQHLKLDNRVGKINLRRRLHLLLEQFNHLKWLSTQTLSKETLTQSFRQQSKTLSEHGLLSQSCQNLFKTCQSMGASACTLSNGQYMVALCDKNSMLLLFQHLNKCLFEQAMFDKSEYSSRKVKKMIFSSLPSRACGVLDPSQEIWFN